MNTKKFVAVMLSLSFICSGLSACKIDSQEEINNRFSVEAVNLTKVGNLDGYRFYVPDSFLEQTNPVSDNKNFQLINDGFIIKAVVLESKPYINSNLSQFVNNKLKENIEVTKIIADEDDNLKAECTVKHNNIDINGYVRVYGSCIILAVCEKQDTAETVVNSLRTETSTYNEKIENISLDNADLSVTVNGLAVGDTVTVDQIKDDFSDLKESFEKMESELSGVNGSAISDINKKVILKFKSTKKKGAAAYTAYLESIEAYNDALNKYNIMLNNGINFDSKKKEIEAAFNVDLSSDWEKLVIKNNNEKSKIESITINYDNNKDKIDSIIVNKKEAFDKAIKESKPLNESVVPETTQISELPDFAESTMTTSSQESDKQNIPSAAN